jgi:hypothetical protein
MKSAGTGTPSRLTYKLKEQPIRPIVHVSLETKKNYLRMHEGIRDEKRHMHGMRGRRHGGASMAGVDLGKHAHTGEGKTAKPQKKHETRFCMVMTWLHEKVEKSPIVGFSYVSTPYRR